MGAGLVRLDVSRLRLAQSRAQEFAAHSARQERAQLEETVSSRWRAAPASRHARTVEFEEHPRQVRMQVNRERNDRGLTHASIGESPPASARDRGAGALARLISVGSTLMLQRSLSSEWISLSVRYFCSVH